jgi:hypothetical protein
MLCESEDWLGSRFRLVKYLGECMTHEMRLRPCGKWNHIFISQEKKNDDSEISNIFIPTSLYQPPTIKDIHISCPHPSPTLPDPQMQSYKKRKAAHPSI